MNIVSRRHKNRTAREREIDSDVARLRRTMWRLGASVAVSFAVIVLALSTLVVLIVLRSQQADATNLLRQAALLADDATDPPAGVWLAISGPQKTAMTPGLPKGLPDEAALRATARTGVAETDQVALSGKRYTIYTMRRPSGTVQAILDLTANQREQARLWMAMMASALLGLLASVVMGVWFGHRAVAPMTAALALQRRFVSDASHELRTPLALLTTRAQLHSRHLHQDAQRDVLTGEADSVVADASHLTDILEDLLFAADTRPGSLSVTIDLVGLAGQVVAAADSAAAQRSVAVALRHRQATVSVRGTLGGLRRALTSLLDNAIRHARASITVTVSQSGPNAIIEVTDDGPGIDAAVLPRIFDRYASAAGDGAAESGRRRYGIGLALVSEIAARHGGEISAHNADGGGATLRLTLPAVSSEDA